MGNETSSEKSFNEEDIGIALFEKVHSFHQENAAKITGMLLEMSQKDLESMLTDDNKLMSSIYEAIKVLDYESERAKLESLGDILYPEVEAVYSEHEVAEKITGMLLEMKVEDIEKLIADKDGLLVKIHEAADVLQRHKNFEHCDSQAMEDPPPSSAELGEKIFESILKWYPDEETAAKLVGMLLEMNIDEIKRLVQEDKLLRCKADEAFTALMNQLR